MMTQSMATGIAIVWMLAIVEVVDRSANNYEGSNDEDQMYTQPPYDEHCGASEMLRTERWLRR